MTNRSLKISCLLFIFLQIATAQSSVLDEYIATQDTNYSWTVEDTITFPTLHYTEYILKLHSLVWRTDPEVNRPQWEHWLHVIIPDTVSYHTAFLLIDGGNNHSGSPGTTDYVFSNIAVTTNSILADLKTIPNQPLVFPDYPGNNYEDEIISYSWDKYLRTGDNHWPVNLPMTKSTHYAMNAIQEFTTELNPSLSVEDFVVSGGSKRGWTTWLTASSDSDNRVKGIIPIVFDALNLVRSFRNHYGSYGEWSPAVEDYENIGIFDWFDNAMIISLMDIVDPYVYRERLTMPKYIMNAVGDEFFTPAIQFYIDSLPGPNYAAYLPNTGHGFDGQEEYAIQSLIAFYQAVLDDAELPQFIWDRSEDGTITVHTQDAPSQVNLWKATNPTHRDFRNYVVGNSAWSSTELMDQGDGRYVTSVPLPDTGWTGFFVELIFDNNYNFPFMFTTEVSIIPNDLPFATDVTFTVEDVTGTLSDIQVTGSMTAWSPTPAFDDGSHGDATPNDHVWTLTIPSVLDGDYQWSAIGLNALGETIWLIEEPFVEFSVLGDTVEGTTDFSYLKTKILSSNPSQFTLYPNYPNPFNNKTTLHYELPYFGVVSINIYDILGRKINKLVNGLQTPGEKYVTWDGTDQLGINVNSGMYFYKISFKPQSQEEGQEMINVRKLILLK
ncbi:MAG: T9SS type A sorting domain-containing protein [Candidatus Marinimicrobia bacterium]|nr:T9SS type A sorting domain-containing protein [Candidatus Neomarinimicrobiota bacterium]